MKIRLGYACISKTLSNVTTSSTITYTTFQKDKDYKKIDTAIKSNLNALKEILTYNIKNNIHFFRLSSKLIPLATKSDVIFDYIDPYKDYYNSIAKIIKDNKLRIDFHPDEFCVLNSTKSEVVKNSIAILEYHYNLLKALEIKNKILVLHIGGNTFGKKNSISRFINNFNTLSKDIQESIAIENDDAFEEGRTFARSEGILVGISSGAALKAADILAKRPENKGKTIVALLPDSGDRYLSTALFSTAE